jgi:hypothetical protein
MDSNQTFYIKFNENLFSSFGQDICEQTYLPVMRSLCSKKAKNRFWPVYSTILLDTTTVGPLRDGLCSCPKQQNSSFRKSVHKTWQHKLQLTNSMKHSSYKTNNLSASQKIPHLLRGLTLHHRVRNRPPLVPILSQINPIHTLTHSRYIKYILPATPKYLKRSPPFRFSD